MVVVGGAVACEVGEFRFLRQRRLGVGGTPGFEVMLCVVVATTLVSICMGILLVSGFRSTPKTFKVQFASAAKEV